MMNVPLTYLDDNGKPDPAGLNFRASCPAEAAATSQVIDRAWVRWVSGGAPSTFTVTAYGPGGVALGVADPRFDYYELPPSVRGFVVSGRRSGPAAEPSVALLTVLK